MPISSQHKLKSLHLFGAMVKWLLLLLNVIQQILNSGSAQVQMLPTAYWRFVMVRILDNGPSWKSVYAFGRPTIPKKFITQRFNMLLKNVLI